MSLRFELSNQSLINLGYAAKPIAFVLWHNRLFLSAEIIRRYRKGRQAYALVSASRDGAWLDAFFGIVNIRTVRGSSSRFGREAAADLIRILKSGEDIGLTPDGPKGPMYEFKLGCLVVAKRAGAPLLLLGGVFESAWRASSWDAFYLPAPFSRVRVSCALVLPTDLGHYEEAAGKLSLRLNEMNADQSEKFDVVIL